MVPEADAGPADLSDFDILASAVAGRTLDVTITRGGAGSYCDGHSIYVDGSTEKKHVGKVVLCHALLLAAGSLSPETVRQLRGRPKATRRYMALELQRALNQLNHLVPGSAGTSLVPTGNADTGDAQESLAIALDRRHAVAEVAEYMGLIRPFRIRRKWRTRGKNEAKAANSRSNPPSSMEELGEDEELDNAANKILKLFSNPLTSGGALADMFSQILGMGRSPGNDFDDDDGGGATSLSRQAMMTQASSKTAESLAVEPSEKLSLIAEQSHWAYPEWHAGQSRYREGWVQVSEIEPWPPDIEMPQERIEITPGQIRSQLVQVGVEFEAHNRQRQGDDIDLDQLVDYAVEVRLRHSPRQNVYRQSKRTRRDLSALILLDASQSTVDKLEDGHSIFGQHREIARKISETLSLFGDRVAIYGFHSWGRHFLRFLRVKTFDEQMSARVQRRLSYIEPAGLTRLGGAIRHATALLHKERYNTHRLMLLFSDGFAYDDEYEGSYAEADTAKALDEARRKGIACVCVNIGTEKDDEALKRVYGESTYLRCAHARELPGRLRRILNAAIYRASLDAIS